MRRAVTAILVALLTAAPVFMPHAVAKLPPLSDEAKVKAAETAAKTAWSDKVGAYKLCQVMDRTAENYRKTAQAAGKTVPSAVETPACADPGPFVPTVPASPPLEAAGAHSPPAMAVAPPSGKATAAEIQGQAKK